MQGKYYTPELKEFHVDFECELKLHELKNWEKHTFLPIETLKGIQDLLERELIRVKYLDKEDIESFGFEFRDNKFILENYILTHIDGIVVLKYVSGYFGGNVFNGRIKNKSELKDILNKIK